MHEQRPHVGVGVLVILVKNNQVLLGKRKNSLGAGTWSFPGGHLEFQETPQECAAREVLEETGLLISNIHSITFTNDIFLAEQKHYIMLIMRADYVEGTPQLREPDKGEQWEWFAWNNLPTPLFLPLQHLIEQGFRL